MVGAQHSTGEEWRNNSRNNEEMEPKQKQHPVVGVISDGSKVRCCNCIGTWNVRSMNQGKLKVVKQEMARVNIYIFWIRELKWTGKGKKTLKGELPRSVGAQYATGNSGEITPEIMKGWSQSKNSTQLWM